MDPAGSGLPISTHVGVGLLMGIPLEEAASLSRGPVEALGVGLALDPTDVAVRGNLATLEEGPTGLMVLDRRAGRVDEGTGELADALSGLEPLPGVSATAAPASQHRVVIRLSGDGLSPHVTDTDPQVDRPSRPVLLSRPLTERDPAASKTAAALNALVLEAHRRLRGHPVNAVRAARGQSPANGVITRGAGSRRAFTSLLHELGLRCAVIAGERTVLGLGRLLGFAAITDDAFTGLADSDVEGKVGAALKAAETHDLVFLHVKAADVLAHDLQPDAKRSYLERLDDALASVNEDRLVIGVTGDHSTDSSTGRHTDDPVPSLIAAPGMRPDRLEVFQEDSCIEGELGRLDARSYLVAVLKEMGADPRSRADAE